MPQPIYTREYKKWTRRPRHHQGLCRRP